MVVVVVVVVGELAVASCGSVLCVSGLSVCVHMELLFVACGCVAVVGKLAVASRGSWFWLFDVTLSGRCTKVQRI